MLEQVIEVEDDIGRSMLMGQVDTDVVIQPVTVLRRINGKDKLIQVEVKVPLHYEEVVDEPE